MTQVVATFYKFVRLPDCAEWIQPWQEFCQTQDIRGTILLAEEGINGTIAGSRQGIDAVLNFLRSKPSLADLQHKESQVEKPPFARLKVRLKKEIVTLGLPEVNPEKKVGTYIQPREWNQLLEDPEVMVVDTRNDYEVRIGSFQGAKNPQTESFRQFPDYVHTNLNPQQHKRVALFCTGGIRCEKATSYLLEHGFEKVYHLQGGILKYLEEVSPEESLWEGECFVFDERVAVKHDLAPGNYEMCHACGNPISENEKNSPQYEEGISCPHCFDQLTEERRARQEVKRLQRLQNQQKE